jgi:hypothetical protein
MVQFRQEPGPFAITVYTSPAPLRVGLVDIGIWVEDWNRHDPVPDAGIMLLLHEPESDTQIEAQLIKGEGRNSQLYVASVALLSPGKWRADAVTLRNGVHAEAVGSLYVAPAPQRNPVRWSYLSCRS